MLWKILKSTLNIGVLFSALVCTPLLFLSHFSVGLSDMLGDFSGRYLPNSTLLSQEKRTNRKAVERAQSKRIEQAKTRARTARKVTARRGAALGKGKRVLIRGAAATAVGWIPVIGLSADVYSLAEDYNDVCELLQIVDEMSELLLVSGGEGLYEQNYCDRPQEGMARIQKEASEVSWPWQDGAAQ